VSEKIRLLFVDDEHDFVKYMTKRLAPHEIEVHAYTSSVQALEQTAGHRFDVGLLDLKMPGMDGEELLSRLKERDPTMEIIILTGHGSARSAFRSAQVGAYEYLFKPCEFVDLVGAINKAYAKHLRAVSREQVRRVDDLMQHAEELQPLTVLDQLKKIHDGQETPASAAAPAKGGDSSTAAE
jgi:two-component system NtrC family response regulator/two-component system response regulator AtoC